jgi:DNA processing protein
MSVIATEAILGPLSSVEVRNAPETLYLMGNQRLLYADLKVGVIGTRKPSARGEAAAKQYAGFLARFGVVVVSGLAMGIDAIAHRSAIDAPGHTIAVLGTPLDKVSPPRNAALQAEIARDHLLISQFPLGHPIRPANFPLRNRTMALLSDATIIIEAGEGSGTLHQGWEALRLGRPLFILEDVVASDLEWPQEMLKYGALVLSHPEELLDALPIAMDSAGGEQTF